MIKYVEHAGHKYPAFQSEGQAIRWILPLAKYYCKGAGLDIGHSKPEWKFEGAIGVEPSINPEYHAMNLPNIRNTVGYDYIISSHCLEHVKENWADVLDYWLSKIKDGGVLFLYLPHSSQTYWHPTSNRKHIHSFDSTEIKAYLQSLGYDPYVTPVDYNNSFAVICYKTKVKSWIDEYSDLIDEIKKVKLILSDDGEVKSAIDDKIKSGNRGWIDEATELIHNDYSGCDTAKGNDKSVMSEVDDKAHFDFKYNGVTIRVCIGGKYGNEIKDAATKSALEHGLVLWWITNPYSLPELTDITRLS